MVDDAVLALSTGSYDINGGTFNHVLNNRMSF